MSNILQILSDIAAPPARLTPSQFAEQFCYVADDGSNSEPGKYRLSRMPHQQAMLDDPVRPGVREVVWQMASQYAGKTMCFGLLAQYVIKVMRRSIKMSRDTKDRALEWMRDKFEPMVEQTPAMAGLLLDTHKRGSRSTSLNRKFVGGHHFKLIGAKSRGAFRGSTEPVIFQDEIDAYESTKEGDACELIDRAAKTFSDAWKIKASTPTLAGFSRINQKFLSGDQQYYFVPCPVCGEFQWLKTEQMKFSFTKEEHARFTLGTYLNQPEYNPNASTWQIGDFEVKDTKRAIYVCEHCRHGWTDSQRLASYFSGHPDNPPVVVNGKELRAEWRATAPFLGITSRHFNGMYGSIGLKQGCVSYLHQWSEEFLEAKRGGRETLMAWTNMFKNEPFEDAYDKLDWEPIAARAENYGPELPAEVMLLMAGIDVHPDRLEVAVYGWGDQEEVWAIDYQVLTCDFDLPMGQELLEGYLFGRRWTHPVLGELEIVGKFIDSGHQTKVKAVYHFARKWREKYVYAVKGFDSALGALYTVADERRFGIKRYNLNVDALKDTISGRLKNVDAGPRFIHFPTEKANKAFNRRFYTQLCSEKRMFIGGQWKWVKPTSSTRNEALDCLVYCVGGYEIMRCASWITKKWQEVSKKLREQSPAPASDKPKEYVLDALKQEKLPDLKQLPATRKPTAPRPEGGWDPGYSGRWR